MRRWSLPYKIEELILEKIENKGMTPPFNQKIHWSNWDITNHGHQWEEE